MDLLEIRRLAEGYDELIIRLLAERAQFSSNLTPYKSKKGTPMTSKDSEGYDYWFNKMQEFYVPVLELLFSQAPGIPGYDFSLDRKLFDLINERIFTIGEAVIEVKGPKGQPIYDEQVEARKKNHAYDRALELGLSPHPVMEIFQHIFDKTRDIEEVIQEQRRLYKKTFVDTTRTQYEPYANLMRKSWQEQGLIVEEIRTPAAGPDIITLTAYKTN